MRRNTSGKPQPGTAARPRLAVRPECTERLAYACDIGSPVRTLEKCFPQLDFAHVQPPDAWWWVPDGLEDPSPRASLAALHEFAPGSKSSAEPQQVVARRIAAFRTWLLEQPESRIVVFGHGAFLRRMMAHQGSMGGVVPWFANCEIRTIRL
jgi:broad specificity phosphatase PhoE